MSADKRAVSTDALETLGMIHTREEHRDAIHLAVEPVEAGEDLDPGEHIFIDVKDGVTRAFKTLTNAGVGIVDPFLSSTVKTGQKFWLVVYPRKITSLRHVWSHPDFAEPINPQLTAEEERLRKANEVNAANARAIAETIKTLSNLHFEMNPDPDLVDEEDTNEVIIFAPKPVDNSIQKAQAYAWIEKYANSLGDNITAEELISYGKDYIEEEKKGGWHDYLVKGGTLEGVRTSDEFWQQLAIYLDIEIDEDFSGNFFSCSC